MRKTIVCIAAGLALTSCSTPPPTPTQVATADYGPYPKNYQAIIVAHMRTILKDPEGARFGFTAAPVKTWFRFDKRIFGWATCVGVNAKNSFGGYTGTQQHYFLIRNGAVVKAEYGRDAGTFDLCPVRGV